MVGIIDILVQLYICPFDVHVYITFSFGEPAVDEIGRYLPLFGNFLTGCKIIADLYLHATGAKEEEFKMKMNYIKRRIY